MTRPSISLARPSRRLSRGPVSLCNGYDALPVELQLFQGAGGQQLDRKILGVPALPSAGNSDSKYIFTWFPDGTTKIQPNKLRQSLEFSIDQEELGIPQGKLSKRLLWKKVYLQSAKDIAKPTVTLYHRSTADRAAFEDNLGGKHINLHDPNITSERNLERRSHTAAIEDQRIAATVITKHLQSETPQNTDHISNQTVIGTPMTSDSLDPAPVPSTDNSRAQHRPLVVGLTKPSTPSSKMDSTEAAAALNHEIEKNVKANTKSAAPAEETPAVEASQPKQKKEKAPKQPKPQKATPAAAPTSPALIDLRVGHILRAIAHPNADSLYVSTIAMGDPEGTEHTQVDEETGKVVRTVCSGLNGLVPLAEMQDRKIIVVANLKPVNMRSIKSAAMVLAASPKQEEGADPHAPDRVVELVMPPEGSEAGDKVYFEGWPYGEGKGPEKQLNPKKKQWEAIQPGFYTGEDLTVGFDAGKCDEVEGSEKGALVVQDKGKCTVKTLKGAVVR